MIKDLRVARDFYLGFANNPQAFITDWIASQSKDLKGLFQNSCTNLFMNSRSTILSIFS